MVIGTKLQWLERVSDSVCKQVAHLTALLASPGEAVKRGPNINFDY
jgi:hypothetical protein